MERSSPLAALQPKSCNWARTDDGAGQECGRNGGNIFAPKFSFKNLATKSASPFGYFANKHTVRGSSPTASLAADLSQNMHIDQSPALPTPRRALFSTNLFTSFNYRAALTTPPLSSSSPGQCQDSMEVSPLPHKPSFYSTVAQVESPLGLMASDDFTFPSSSPAPVQNIPAPIRRRPSAARQGLARVKSTSSSSITRPNAPGFFSFNMGPRPTCDTLSLGDCFASSPPQERSDAPQSELMPPPRPKQLFHTLSGSGRSNGSPAAGVIRRSNAAPTRPRKQFRRALSMFEHAEDVVNSEEGDFPCNLQSIMDIDEVHKPQLPYFIPTDQPDSLPRITSDTFIDVLDDKFSHIYEKVIIIDCRFEYEFAGGHIKSAVNYNDKETLGNMLFSTSQPARTLLIFHCEYSAHRAPIMAKYIRHTDRAANEARYPNLTFPELYLLDGGYSSFFTLHLHRCYPQNYVEMDAKEHALTCEREMGKLRQHSKLSRAQTYSMGQRQRSVFGSPTRSAATTDDMMGWADDFDARRGATRRMASY